jgi:hypothetical protein
VHLAHGTDPSAFVDARITATRSYLQTALVLAQLGRVRIDVVGAVARDLRGRGVSEQTLRAHVREASERLHVNEETIAAAGLHEA